MTPQLSEGALATICQGGEYNKPVLQVLSFKKIAGSATDRYRLLISDGRYSNSYAMLATQANDKISNNELTDFSIVRVNRHLCNNMQGKKVIVVLELEVLKSGSEVGKKLGQPIPINADGTVSSENMPNKPAHVAKRAGDEEGAQPPPKKPLQSRNSPVSRLLDPTPSFPLSSQGAVSTLPISAITPYQNRWTIKARVTSKSDIRRWNNARGEGHLFSMDLIDESGEIRATAFKEQCDKFYPMIEVGKVYLISSCILKPANRQYSNIKNEYEITFRETTEVSLCSDDTSSVPSITFNFVRIADLNPSLKDQVVDILGVCKSASDVMTINSQKLNKELRKRDVTLVDKSMAEVNVTFWGSNADNFDPTGNPVVAIKGVKVSDYNGVSLSSLGSSVIQINPDMDQSHDLKNWYDSEGSTANIISMTMAGGRGGAGGSDSGSNMKTFIEAKQENIGMNSDKAEYFSATAYIAFIKKENALYQGCANEVDGRTCNKKVQDQNNGLFRCEKCNLELDNFNWRLILSVNVVDMTDNQWVQCFQEQGEDMLGIKAQDLGDLLTSDKEAYDKVFEAASFKRFNCRFRCKSDTYNEQSRVRSTIQSATRIGWPEFIGRLARELQGAGAELPHKFNVNKYA